MNVRAGKGIVSPNDTPLIRIQLGACDVGKVLMRRTRKQRRNFMKLALVLYVSLYIRQEGEKARTEQLHQMRTFKKYHNEHALKNKNNSNFHNNNMSLSLKTAQVIRCVNAGISCLASTFIVLMILTEQEKGLASPYSRIIFAMSISDILFSLGILASPFVGPRDNPDALFAMGSIEACEAFGFLFLLGIQCLLLYTLFLTYYFMKRIKYKITPQTFTNREEKYFHFFICSLSISLALSALVTGNINSQNMGSVCDIGSYPYQCDQSIDMVCQRGGKYSTKVLTAYGGICGAVCFVLLIVVLALSTHHVYLVESTLTIPARAIGDIERGNHRGHVEENDDDNREKGNEERINDEESNNNREQGNEERINDEENYDNHEEQGNQERNIDEESNNNEEEGNEEAQVAECWARNRFILTKQAFQQSVLYVMAFLLVYFAPTLGILLRRFRKDHDEDPEWRFWLSALLTPLGGVFNILIYCRPKVLRLKESYPHVTKLKLLIVIVLTGGEIPSLADVRQRREPANRPNNNNEEYNRPLRSRREEREQKEENENEANRVLYDMDISEASEFLSMMEYARNGFYASVFDPTR